MNKKSIPIPASELGLYWQLAQDITDKIPRRIDICDFTISQMKNGLVVVMEKAATDKDPRTGVVLFGNPGRQSIVVRWHPGEWYESYKNERLPRYEFIDLCKVEIIHGSPRLIFWRGKVFIGSGRMRQR